MKKIIIIPLLLLSIGIFSCKKETVQPLTNPDNNERIMNPGLFIFSTCNDWTIQQFLNNNIDQTIDYSLMKFRFCPDNTVVAFNDLFSMQGTWYFLLDKGNPNYLQLSFTGQGNIVSPYHLLADVEGKWKIAKLQGSLIWLQTDDRAKIMVFEKGK